MLLVAFKSNTPAGAFWQRTDFELWDGLHYRNRFTGL